MKLRQSLKFLTALAVLATATPGFAQIITSGGGEGGSFTAENVDGALELQGLYSEARNAGHLLAVWRGATNNQVWMSLDNGKPFTIGGTVTFVDPTVAPFGSDSFMVFHTGDEGNIFYTQVFGDGTNSGTWTSVPGNFTNLSVSVAQMGTNSNDLFLVYRGLGNDLRVWGTWYDGQTNTWAAADNISGGSGNGAPGIAMNNATNQLIITLQGTDNQLWMTHQTLGASSWNSWTPMGEFTGATAHSAACANGNMVVSVVDPDNNSEPAYAKFDGFGNRTGPWTEDGNDLDPFLGGIQLTANGNNVYALADLSNNGSSSSSSGSGEWRMIYACN
jgi:hypothetical protein